MAHSERWRVRQPLHEAAPVMPVPQRPLSRPWLRVLAGLLLWAVAAHARSSIECVDLLYPNRHASDCASPVCGTLNVSSAEEGFYQRLSWSCRLLMDEYRAALSDFTFQRRPDDPNPVFRGNCPSFEETTTPTNPVVVMSDASSPFGMCTAPRAGGTFLRTLLVVLTRHPRPIIWIGKRENVNSLVYPSLDHFFYKTPLPDTFPTFVVGRNPYIRVLGGFLEEIATFSSNNGNLFNYLYEDSQDGFRSFIKQLRSRMARGESQSESFSRIVDVCRFETHAFAYRLRIEDLTKWFPCFEGALGLDPITQVGWDYSRQPKSSWYSQQNAGCYWSPDGVSCGEYRLFSRCVGDAGQACPGQGRKPGQLFGNDPERHRFEVDYYTATAEQNWPKYYDQEVADLVYEVYEADFEAFGYRRELANMYLY